MTNLFQSVNFKYVSCMRRYSVFQDRINQSQIDVGIVSDTTFLSFWLENWRQILMFSLNLTYCNCSLNTVIHIQLYIQYDLNLNSYCFWTSEQRWGRRKRWPFFLFSFDSVEQRALIITPRVETSLNLVQQNRSLPPPPLIQSIRNGEITFPPHHPSFYYFE